MDSAASLCNRRVERMWGEPGGQALLSSEAQAQQLFKFLEREPMSSSQDNALSDNSATVDSEVVVVQICCEKPANEIGPRSGAGADDPSPYKLELSAEAARSTAALSQPPARIQRLAASVPVSVFFDRQSPGTGLTYAAAEVSEILICRQDHEAVRDMPALYF